MHLYEYEYEDEIRPELLEIIPADGDVIGSVGCGGAATEALLVRAGRKVHGVDIAQEAIDVATPRLTSAQLVLPGNHQPFARDSLDGLILADVLEHIPEAWGALVSYAQMVRPGGWIVISIPNMRYAPALVRLSIEGDWPERPSGTFDKTHVQVMTRKRLGRWCRAAGLTVERWVDKYDPYRMPAVGILDRMTLRVFHEFLTFQLIALCRVGQSSP
jgi:2-polyprenyl-3-methyl-5-hydroxy-6-metoxy-1,4-benzoquinol methylase